MAVTDLKTKIKAITNEDDLRELREYADKCLQEVKESKAFKCKAKLENEYKDKYLLKYGRNVCKAFSTVNKKDMEIIHIIEIVFAGRGFFRCKVKGVHIKFDDDYRQISHLTANDWGSVYVSYLEDDQYDIRGDENNIGEIITKEKAMELIETAKNDFNDIVTKWDI